MSEQAVKDEEGPIQLEAPSLNLTACRMVYQGAEAVSAPEGNKLHIDHAVVQSRNLSVA